MDVTAPVTAPESILLRQDAGGVATLTLNRPQQFNALSSEMLDALQTALDAINEDRSVRVHAIRPRAR